MTAPGPDYGPAAQRHLDDADHLQRQGRFANADHLAGLSAECALKAVAVSFLGVQAKATGAPTTTIQGQPKTLAHLPTLWTTMSALISGRQGSTLAKVLIGPNQFARWAIDERYHRGDLVTPARAVAHVNAARTLVSLYLQAKLAGMLR